MLQEEMVNIRTMQQPQIQESTGECTPSGPAQSALPCITEYNINFAVRSQRRGHLNGVRH